MPPLLLCLLFFFIPASAGPIATEYLFPNFTASNFLYVDTAGVFLVSPNGTFHAAIVNPGQQQSHFYLTLVHVPTNTIVWAANRNTPISNSGTLDLNQTGLTISDASSLAWSTPRLPAPVHKLRLLDSGNLILLDAANNHLWQSFEHPTDTLLSGQTLPAGAALVSPVSEINLSDGDYQLSITRDDAIMRWMGSQQYWSLSGDTRSFKDYNDVVAYMGSDANGIYLFSSKGRSVFEVALPFSGFRIMKLDSSGRLHIVSYSSSSSRVPVGNEFVAPSSDCDLPFPCFTLGLCVAGSNSSTCNCPRLFGPNTQTKGCVPAGSGSTLSSCTNGGNGMVVSYLSLGSEIDYFANRFTSPTSSGDDMSVCRSSCSGNCSCLGFFYVNSSRACYLLKNQLGSLTSTSSGNSLGFIKILASSELPAQANSTTTTSMGLIAILLPTIVAFLLVVVLLFVGTMWRRRMKRGRLSMVRKEVQLRRQQSRAAGVGLPEGEGSDSEEISILGLPARFSYAELEVATDNFQVNIGSGGFGEVYKGVLPDKTVVAVKKITGTGVHGRREFCAEIAVIGNIHHVNLVRLRGFCADGARRLLVFEYMNRGSLDRSLFGLGPALEWQERVDIAVGAARGLAYLHTGCEHRIIHCDVKPENILLHDGGQVKITDFGLAKLLTPEQSGLFTTMRGTRGYLAPEWLTNSAISSKTDVYSYGMVLLEIVRGRKNRSLESEAAGGDSEWSGSAAAVAGGYFPMVALEMHERGRYLELVDPRLSGRVTALEVERVVRVALCCLHEEPALRPSMAAVAGMLEGVLEVWEPRLESLSFLRFYGRGFAVSSGENRVVMQGVNFTASGTSSATTTSGSQSYLSSQEVSGPR